MALGSPVGYTLGISIVIYLDAWYEGWFGTLVGMFLGTWFGYFLGIFLESLLETLFDYIYWSIVRYFNVRFLVLDWICIIDWYIYWYIIRCSYGCTPWVVALFPPWFIILAHQVSCACLGSSQNLVVDCSFFIW